MSGWLLVSTAVMVIVVALVVLATAVRKLVQDGTDRAYRRAREAVRPAVFAFVASEGHASSALLKALEGVRASETRRRRAAANELLTAYGSKLRGDVVERIRAFFRHHGFAGEARSDLTAKNPWRRALALQELGFLADPEGLDELTACLADPDFAVRVAAARALGALGDPRAAPALLRACDGSRTVPYGVVSAALLRIGPEASDALLAGLEHPSFRVRRMAIDLLGELRVTAARHRILTLLREDRDTLVRIRAAHALGRLGTADLLDELYASMADENADIRQSVLRAVANVGARSSIPVLRAALADPDHATARVAASSLRAMGEPGHQALRDAASGEDSAAQYALEALDEIEPVDAERRAWLRSWDPLVVAERSFPTVEQTQR